MLPEDKPVAPFGNPDTLHQSMVAQSSEARDLLLKFEPTSIIAALMSQMLHDQQGWAPEGPGGVDALNTYQFGLEYLHAVLCCYPEKDHQNQIIDTESLKRLVAIMDSLRRDAMRYSLATSINSDRKTFEGASSEIEFAAKSSWVAIRGNRHQALEAEFLEYVLRPHDAELIKQYGVGAKSIAKILQLATDNIRYGFSDAFSEYEACMKIAARFSKKKRLSPEDGLAALVKKDKKYKARADAAMEDMFYAGFCNLSKKTRAPINLLNDLSYEQGGNTEFFSPGEFCGTPMRTLPARLRPLVRLKKGVYAVDPQFMRDSSYRAIQRGITAGNPQYKEIWKERQAKLLEGAFSAQLAAALRGSSVYSGVWYRSPYNDQWTEVDHIIQYQDVMVVIEAKAGSSTLSSPETDFKSHVRSVQNLVLDAYRQARRFIEYLYQGPDMPIFERRNGTYVEIATLNVKAMRRVFPIGLTIESYSPFSGMCKQLPEVTPILGKHPFVSMGLDELMVLRRLLPTIGQFLHYMGIRQDVAGIREARLFDEMDHLGAYITHNRFTMTLIEQLQTADMVTLNNFSDIIEKYFEQEDWCRKPVPSQRFPPNLAKLLRAMDDIRPDGFLRADSQLRDSSGSGRRKFETILERLMFRGRTAPIKAVVGGDDGAIQFYVLPSMDLISMMDFERTAMLACLAFDVEAVDTIIVELRSKQSVSKMRIVNTLKPTILRKDYSQLVEEAALLKSRGMAF